MASDASDRQWTGGALLGLDIGSQRIGVAITRPGVRIAHPLQTILADDSVYGQIIALAAEHQAQVIVAGWPRGLSGQHTEQTGLAERFVEQLRNHTAIPIALQDEALTSQKAEAELKSRNKPYDRGEVDALAATFILDDYMSEHPLEHQA